MELSDASENVCNTCHATEGVMSMFGFKSFLGAQGHFPLPEEFYTHADACVICHTGREVHGGFAEEFGKLVHKGHFVDPEGRVLGDGNNHFVLFYGGQCTHCHKINPDGTFSMPGMESLFEDNNSK
jgi:cytochrome c peroxidase